MATCNLKTAFASGAGLCLWLPAAVFWPCEMSCVVYQVHDKVNKCFFSEGKEIVGVCNFCAQCSHGRNSTPHQIDGLNYKRFNLLVEKQVEYIFLGNRIGIMVLVTFSISVCLPLSLSFPLFALGYDATTNSANQQWSYRKFKLQFGSLIQISNFEPFTLYIYILSCNPV